MRIEKFGFEKFAVRLYADKYVKLSDPSVAVSKPSYGTFEECLVVFQAVNKIVE